MILFIDNYDSFTYNLVHMLGHIYSNILVKKNDRISLDEIATLQPEGVVISPGPGTPVDAGISCAVIERFYQVVPILGVCLGHQCIGSVFGAKIEEAPVPVHGKLSNIFHHQEGIFNHIPTPFPATRYHSLIVSRESLPAALKITAETEDGLVMGMKHAGAPLVGVQFHPEAILTEYGKKMLRNWIRQYVGGEVADRK